LLQLKIILFIGIVRNLCGKFSISEHTNRMHISMYIETSGYVCINKPTDLFDASSKNLCKNLDFFVFFNIDEEYPACNFRKKRKPTIFTACFNAPPRVIHLFSWQTVHAVQEIKLFLP